MFISPSDLAPFATIDQATADAMIQDAEAQACMVAPCLADPAAPLTDGHRAAVLAILRRAILRWHEVGTGVVTQAGAGPFQQSIDTTRSAPRGLFWPSEITDLQAICKSVGDTSAPSRKVFTISTGRTSLAVHSPLCDLTFGGATCSCGSDLNAYRGPLPEFGETL